MPIKWDEAAMSTLCVSIVNVLGPEGISAGQKIAIVEKMKEAGYPDAAWNGIRQHLQKLKKKEPGGPTSSAPSTPKGRKTAGSGPKSSGKRGRGAKAAAADPDQDQDDDFQESPTKKVKAELKSDETKNDIVKFEHDAEKDVDVV